MKGRPVEALTGLALRMTGSWIGLAPFCQSLCVHTDDATDLRQPPHGIFVNILVITTNILVIVTKHLSYNH